MATCVAAVHGDGALSVVGEVDAVGVGGESDATWWRSVEELELNHQHLRKLSGLEKLVSLRRASFCNNELARVEGLERCANLEELCLEDPSGSGLEITEACRQPERQERLQRVNRWFIDALPVV